MSTLRFQLKHRRWPVTLAIILTFVLAAAAFAFPVIGVVGTWGTATGGTCLGYDNTQGTGNNQVRWGTAGGVCNNTVATDKSGYGFDGIEAPSPGEDIGLGVDFLLGTFTHYNFPITSDAITSVPLNMAVTICGEAKSFPFTFAHVETPNNATPCAYRSGSPDWPPTGDPNSNGCADRVTLPILPTEVTFTCPGGNVYTLTLTGFIPITTGACPATPPGSTAQYFYTVEGATNVACVYGSITNPLGITLASMSAAAQGPAIQVTWDTATEMANAGFNLYRDTSPAGLGVKLNAALIPSQGPNSSTGFSYSYTDSANLVSGTTYYYRLEDVSLGDTTSVHEPVSVTYAAPTAVGLASFGAGAVLPALPFVAAGLAALAGLGLALRRR